MAELIPPAIIEVLANAGGFDAVYDDVVAKITALGKLDANANLGADGTRVDTGIANAAAKAKAFAKETWYAGLGVDLHNAEVNATLASLDATIKGAKADVIIGAQLDTASVAKAVGEADAMVKTMDVALSFGLPALPKDLAAVAGGSGKGGGSTGLVDLLGFGKDSGGFLSKLFSPLTMLSTLFSAKFGSLGSLAGFGPEHLATTLGAVGGVGVSGGLGAGMLGLGSLGKMAVGSGSDSLVSHEVLSNISLLNQGLATYDSLVKKVGVDGAQAATQLNKAWSQTKKSFDQLTGPAQLEFSKLGQSVLKVADSYIPLIASAATKNFAIIEKAIQPLLKWLTGTGSMQGKGIFASLEGDFAKTLPTTISALSGAFEHLMRVVDIAAGYTGTFMKELNQKEAFSSTAAGINKTRSDISKWIGDFRLVDKFVKILGKDLVDIFSKDAHTGVSVIKLMTKGLEQLNKWINSTGGSSALKNLFSVHKGETLELMKSLGELLTSFGSAYLKVAPYLVTFVTDILKLANGLFQFTQKIPGLGQLVAVGTGLAIMEAKSKTLTNSFKLLTKGFGLVQDAGKLAGGVLLGLGGEAEKAEEGIATTGAKIGTLASKAGSMASNVASSAGKALGSLGDMVRGAVGLEPEAEEAGNGLSMALGGVVVAAVAIAAIEIVKHWRGVLTGLKAIWGAIQTAAVAVWHFIESNWKTIVTVLVGVITGPIGALVIWLATHWGTVETDAKNVWNRIVSFFTGLAAKFKDIGKDIVNGIVSGIKAAAGKAIAGIKKVGSDILGGFKSVLHIFSPSQVMAEQGKNIVQGIAQGISSDTSAVTAVTKLSNAIVTAFGSSSVSKGMTTAVKTLGDLGKALSSLSSGATTLTQLASSSESLKAASSGIKALVTTLGHLVVSLGHIKGLAAGESALSKLSSSFSKFSTAASDISKVANGLSSLDTALKTLSSLAQGTVRLAITELTTSLRELSRRVTEIKGLPTATSELKKLGTALSDLTKSAGSLGTLAAGLVSLVKAINEIGTLRAGQKKIENLVRDVKELVSGVSGITGATQAAKLVNDLATALSSLTTALTNLSTTASTKLTALLSDFTTFAGSALAQMKALPPQFQSIGLQLMQGLAQGIQQGVATAVAAAQQAAQAIAAATRGSLQISSPSKVFAVIGANTMQGFAQGITANASLPRSAMTSALGALSGTASIGVHGGAGHAGAGGVTYSPTYHLDVKGDVSPQTVQKMKQMLVQHDNELIQKLRAGTAMSG